MRAHRNIVMKTCEGCGQPAPETGDEYTLTMTSGEAALLYQWLFTRVSGVGRVRRLLRNIRLAIDECHPTDTEILKAVKVLIDYPVVDIRPAQDTQEEGDE